ncbi:DNA-3-methyladenine glycosylase II PWA37_002036 [Arxiozyma heterogenica]|uniref:DNA-3-methyladenine glycosylase II n=1 Tax=Arxiozyma heterogenica TaxID=278026 RepID=UPI002EDD38C1
MTNLKRDRIDGDNDNDNEGLNNKKQKLVDCRLPSHFIELHSESFIEACNHVLEVDPTLLPILTAGNFSQYLKSDQSIGTCKDHNNNNNNNNTVDLQECFSKLANAIIGQQISNRAARSIRERLYNYFDGQFPAFKTLYDSLQDPIIRKEIKSCGLSDRKLIYLESLSQYFNERIKEIETLFTLDTNDYENDQRIIDHLVKNIKGIGPWTASMFLITGLKRQNVFTADDLGIARGFSNYIATRKELLNDLIERRISIKRSKIKHKKYKWKIYDNDIIESCAQKFEPHRTLFMFLLWRLSSDNIEDMVKIQEEFMQN